MQRTDGRHPYVLLVEDGGTQAPAALGYLLRLNEFAVRDKEVYRDQLSRSHQRGL